jgi:peptide/nickel transport system substrate-binding protein
MNRHPTVYQLRFLTVEPGEQTARALSRGEADVLRWVPEGLVDRVSHLPGVRVLDQPGLRAVYLWLNAEPRAGEAPNPLHDRRVRQALSLAIDRRALAARLARWSQPLHQFIPPGIFGHDPDLTELPFDPGRARELLREAGHPQGLDLTLTYVRGAEAEVDAVQAALSAVGIRVKLEESDWPTMHARWRAGRLPFFLASWRFETGEASQFLQECVLSRQPGSVHSWNPGFSDARLDELVRENFRRFGNGTLLARFEPIQQRLGEEMPLVPLLSRRDLYGVAERVKWRPRMDGRLLGAEMTFN